VEEEVTGSKDLLSTLVVLPIAMTVS